MLYYAMCMYVCMYVKILKNGLKSHFLRIFRFGDLKI